MVEMRLLLWFCCALMLLGVGASAAGAHGAGQFPGEAPQEIREVRAPSTNDAVRIGARANAAGEGQGRLRCNRHD